MQSVDQSKLLSLETTIYKKLIGIFIKAGYKNTASKFLNYALLLISKKSKFSFSYIVWQIFNKCFTRIEVRNVSIKGKNIMVPFIINKTRRIYLAIKWLLRAITESKKKSSLVTIIVEEILALVLNKKSKILEYKEKNYKAALANKSNLHYRW